MDNTTVLPDRVVFCHPGPDVPVPRSPLLSILRTTASLYHENDQPPPSEESRSQWNEKQANIFHIWLGIQEEKGRQNERWGMPFFS